MNGWLGGTKDDKIYVSGGVVSGPIHLCADLFDRADAPEAGRQEGRQSGYLSFPFLSFPPLHSYQMASQPENQQQHPTGMRVKHTCVFGVGCMRCMSCSHAHRCDAHSHIHQPSIHLLTRKKHAIDTHHIRTSAHPFIHSSTHPSTQPPCRSLLRAVGACGAFSP